MLDMGISYKISIDYRVKPENDIKDNYGASP